MKDENVLSVKPVIIAAVDDIFFSAKIDAAARIVGVELRQATDAHRLEEQLATLTPTLIVLDLNSKACAPLQAIRRIKADPRTREIPLVGFLSHVQVDLQEAAREAGCDQILPRSIFSANLAQILRTGKP